MHHTVQHCRHISGHRDPDWMEEKRAGKVAEEKRALKSVQNSKIPSKRKHAVVQEDVSPLPGDDTLERSAHSNSGFMGVFKQGTSAAEGKMRWRAVSTNNGKWNQIGLYPTRIEAARARRDYKVKEAAMDVEAKQAEGEWSTEGHPWIGQRVARHFKGELMFGRINRWLPAGVGKDNFALWHVLHDDGDEEDLEMHEVQTAFKLHKESTASSKDAVVAPLPGDNELECSTHSASGFIGVFKQGSGNAKNVKWRAVSTKNGWLQVGLYSTPIEAARGRRDYLRSLAEDGEATEASPPDSSLWNTEGHMWLGERVARGFKGDIYFGKVDRWMPAGEEEGDFALWHMLHDDGDEEDLEAHEVRAAIRLNRRMVNEEEGAIIHDGAGKVEQSAVGDDTLAHSTRGTSGYAGVTLERGKWVAYCPREDGSKCHIGNFDTCLEAARARRDFIATGAAGSPEPKGLKKKKAVSKPEPSLEPARKRKASSPAEDKGTDKKSKVAAKPAGKQEAPKGCGSKQVDAGEEVNDASEVRAKRVSPENGTEYYVKREGIKGVSFGWFAEAQLAAARKLIKEFEKRLKDGNDLLGCPRCRFNSHGCDLCRERPYPKGDSGVPWRRKHYARDITKTGSL